MSALQSLADLVSIKKYKPPPAGVAANGTPPVNQNPYLTKQNLTFSGITVAAGLILNVVAGSEGTWRVIAAVAIAAVFGLFLIYLALIDVNRETGPGAVPTIWFLGVVNTVLLGISLYGVSSI